MADSAASATKDSSTPPLRVRCNSSITENPDIFDLAACYAHGIVKNHPFLDGNKRAAFMAAYTFLGINGFRLEAPEEQAVLHTLALAASELESPAFAARLRQACSKRP